MGTYIKKRLFALLPILFGVSLITFLLMVIAPGDPAEMKLLAQGVTVSDAVLNQVREEMGLNQPVVIQYLKWLVNLLRGDMGISYVDHLPVFHKLVEAMKNTLILAVSAMFFTLVISIPLGILCAVYQNRWVDYLIRFISFLGASVPNFILSLFLIYFFAMKLNVLPVLASNSFQGLILPTLSLVIIMSSRYIRQIRAAFLDELSKEYVLGLRSRGVRESVILYKNVLKNSMITIVTLVGLSFGSLLGGAAVIETIFVWRGMGKLVVDAIGARDYPVIQGFVVWMALSYVIINLITDISYGFLDPRVKFDMEVQR